MKKILISFSVALFLLSLALPTALAVTIEAGENVLTNQSILDDAYVLAGNANIKADVFGDLYIGGGSVVIDGDIHEDLVVGAGMVTVSGDVLGDLRVIGGKVAVYGNVGDDLILVSGQVDLGKNSVVGGSILAGTGILTMDGVVKEDVRGGMGMLFLNGEVGGDVIVTVEDKFIIDEKAKIGGNLKYSALLEANVPKGVVQGKTSFNKFERDSILQNLTYVFLIHKALSFVSALLILLLLVIFVPKILIKSGEITKANILKSFGVGLLTMIAGLIVPLILMFSVVGVPLGLISFAALMILMYLAKIFAASWAASYFINAKKKLSKWKIFSLISAALFAYYLISLVPYVGLLAEAVLFLIGAGSLVLLKIEYVKMMKAKKLI